MAALGDGEHLVAVAGSVGEAVEGDAARGRHAGFDDQVLIDQGEAAAHIARHDLPLQRQEQDFSLRTAVVEIAAGLGRIAGHVGPAQEEIEALGRARPALLGEADDIGRHREHVVAKGHLDRGGRVAHPGEQHLAPGPMAAQGDHCGKQDEDQAEQRETAE